MAADRPIPYLHNYAAWHAAAKSPTCDMHAYASACAIRGWCALFGTEARLAQGENPTHQAALTYTHSKGQSAITRAE